VLQCTSVLDTKGEELIWFIRVFPYITETDWVTGCSTPLISARSNPRNALIIAALVLSIFVRSMYAEPIETAWPQFPCFPELKECLRDVTSLRRYSRGCCIHTASEVELVDIVDTLLILEHLAQS
jgi:hypothetical protein